MARTKDAKSAKAYSFQIRIPWDVRNLYYSLNADTRKKVKDKITKMFQDEIELCADQGEEYEPLENTPD
jgi:hypothetical protein